MDTVAKFTNLDSLTIGVREENVKALISAGFKLTHFNVSFCYWSSGWSVSSGKNPFTLELLISVLKSPPLSKVENLSLQLHTEAGPEFQEWTDEGGKYFVEAISNLKSLQFLKLSHVPMRTTCFQSLSGLTNIKSISWEGRLLDAKYKRNQFAIAMDAISSVFLEFEEKPEIWIKLLPKWPDFRPYNNGW